MAGEQKARRTIMADFAPHGGDIQTLAEWLSKVVDGRVAADVTLPPDTHPLDHFLGALDRHGNRQQVQSVAKAAAELLLKWRFAHKDEITHDRNALDRLSGILSILEVIPAHERVSSDLFFLSRLVTLGGIGPRRHDIRRQAIHALALRPPTELDAATLRELFSELMGDPEYAVAAFGGLQRISLSWAAEQAPRLLRTLRQRDISPLQAMWNLFRDLEFEPEAARHLGEVLRTDAELADESNALLERLRASERFPAAWAAYTDALRHGGGPAGDPDRASGIGWNRQANRIAHPEIRHAHRQLAALPGPLLR